MGGKSLDDDVTQWSSARRAAYQRGVDDTHARYEQMQARAREWLQACVELVGKWERVATNDADLRNGPLHKQHAAELRAALNLDPSVKIAVDDACGDTHEGHVCDRGAGHPGSHESADHDRTW